MTRIAAAALCVLVGLYWFGMGPARDPVAADSMYWSGYFMFPDPAVFARVLGCM